MSKYHYLSKDNFTPTIVSSKLGRFFRRTVWKVQDRDGMYGTFTSVWLLNHLQFYFGSSKCDGTESHLANHIVMTDEPKELNAFRWRRVAPSLPHWDNMGGT